VQHRELLLALQRQQLGYGFTSTIHSVSLCFIY